MKNYFLLQLVLIFLILVFTVSGAYATYDAHEAAVIYNEAGTLYQNGEFEKSLSMYKQLIEDGISNPELFYNTSNAAYRSGSLGIAILYIERSLKLNPSDPEALSNRAFLNSIKKDQEPLNANIILAFLSRHYDAVNINSVALWSGISFTFTMIIATISLFLNKWRKMALIGILALCGLVFLFSTGLLIHKIQVNNNVIEAIIMTDEAKSYSGPGKDNTHIFTIHEGTKVVKERIQGAWNLIRLKSGAGGWIHSECIEEI